jgi:hypothetical protein
MLTTWDGFGLPPDNVVTASNVLVAKMLPVMLSDTPDVPTQITLDPNVLGLRLWTATDSVRYSLDQPPEVLPVGPVTDLLIDFGVFRLGDMLLPGQWQHCVVATVSGTTHALYLTSKAAFAIVTVIALLEG